MYQEEIKLTYGEGRYKILITSILTSDGISVTVTGGEKPHVGAVAVSVPRKSLNSNGFSCDTWVCPVPGHKDNIIALLIAEMISLKTCQTAAVTVGIHIDKAEEQEIQRIINYSKKAAGLLIDKIKQFEREHR